MNSKISFKHRKEHFEIDQKIMPKAKGKKKGCETNEEELPVENDSMMTNPEPIWTEEEVREMTEDEAFAHALNNSMVENFGEPIEDSEASEVEEETTKRRPPYSGPSYGPETRRKTPRKIAEDPKIFLQKWRGTYFYDALEEQEDEPTPPKRPKFEPVAGPSGLKAGAANGTTNQPAASEMQTMSAQIENLTKEMEQLKARVSTLETETDKADLEKKFVKMEEVAAKDSEKKDESQQVDEGDVSNEQKSSNNAAA